MLSRGFLGYRVEVMNQIISLTLLLGGSVPTLAFQASHIFEPQSNSGAGPAKLLQRGISGYSGIEG